MQSGYIGETVPGGFWPWRCKCEQDCGGWMRRRRCKIWQHFQATGWKRCAGTVKDSTAFASTTSGESVSVGVKAFDVEIIDYH